MKNVDLYYDTLKYLMEANNLMVSRLEIEKEFKKEIVIKLLVSDLVKLDPGQMCLQLTSAGVSAYLSISSQKESNKQALLAIKYANISIVIAICTIVVQIILSIC